MSEDKHFQVVSLCHAQLKILYIIFHSLFLTVL